MEKYYIPLLFLAVIALALYTKFGIKGGPGLGVFNNQATQSANQANFPQSESNLKIFSDPYGRFIFKYPSSWQTNDLIDQSLFVSVFSDGIRKNSLSIEYEMHCPYKLKCEGLNDSQKVEQWTSYNLSSTSQFLTGGKVVSDENIQVDGINARKLTVQERKPTASSNKKRLWIFIPHKDAVHMTHASWEGPDTQILDQILSTFEFL